MSRLRQILFVLVLGIAVAACGGEGEPVATSEPTPSASPAPTTEPAAAAQPAPTAVPEPTATTETVVEPTATTETVVEPTAEPAAAVASAAVAYDDDFGTSIAPIFAENCASCHNSGGPGAAHWRLDQAADLASTHQWIAGVVSVGYMPPWPAGDLSLTFHDDRRLSADQLQAIADWSAAGGPLDVEPETKIVSANGIVALDFDVELTPHEPFQGSTAVADDYRCLIYEIGVDEPTWLRGFEFAPDQPQIVHHAIGYLAPARELEAARALSAQDELGGWQCYGSSGLDGDSLFLGWAPGQLATEFPDGTGLLVEPGDFIVLQIHYHFDTPDAPEDASTLRLDWVEGAVELDEIEFDEFIGPAEIPCSTSESGPLCDRDAALASAFEKYGVGGVLSEGINQVCGVTPADFAEMTNGTASSACEIPVRHYGDIVSVFGHEHEIGSSIRITLNAGRADEQILLDIPDWDFDWQYNYYPTETVTIEPGDSVLLECTWDRSRRDPSLEPAYVLWADGTNDEMCFATISTRRNGDFVDEGGSGIDEAVPLPPEVADCLAAAGVSLSTPPDRSEIDAVVDELFACMSPEELGDLLSGSIAQAFGDLVGDEGLSCLSAKLGTRDGAKALLTYLLPDSTEAERQPTGEIVGDCVLLSDALAEFGFPLPESTNDCVDEAGRELIVQATVGGELPEEQVIFGAIAPCLSEG